MLSCVQLFVTPWTAACQASLPITNSWSLLKLMSIKLMMPSNHLILCHPLLLPPSIFPSIRVFSNESALHIRWPKYWSFSLSLSPSVMSLCSVLSSVLPQQKFEVTDVKALRQTVSQLSDRSVLQLCVTAQFYLENKRKIHP